MDVLEYINQINLSIIVVLLLCVIVAVLSLFNNRGRNFRSSRNKRARNQF